MTLRSQEISISRGTRISAQGLVWVVEAAANGRYIVRADGDSRTYTMPCAELHADLASGSSVRA